MLEDTESPNKQKAQLPLTELSEFPGCSAHRAQTKHIPLWLTLSSSTGTYQEILAPRFWQSTNKLPEVLQWY